MGFEIADAVAGQPLEKGDWFLTVHAAGIVPGTMAIAGPSPVRHDLFV